MNVASLIGFAAAFVVAAWVASVLARLAITGIARGQLDLAVERRLIELGAVVPAVFALTVVAILLVVSLVGGDHCADHHHAAHLCLVHGGTWAEQSWAVILVAVAGALVIARSIRLLVGHLRARRVVAELRAIATFDSDAGIHWIATEQPVSFVTRAGELFVSTGAWNALAPVERAAMLAHEHAHVAQRDLPRRFLLELFGLFAAPWTSVQACWHEATEVLCDARAAEVIDDREAVASAIVKLARLGRGRIGLANFTPTDSVDRRVRALLDERPVGDGRWIGWLASAATLGAIALIATHAPLLHDVLEDVLG